MSGWDLETGNGGGNEDKLDFVTFPEGITRLRIVSDEPHVRWTHWMQNVTENGKGRSITCPGQGCPICTIRKQQKANGENYTYNMSKRFSMLVLNRETEKLEIMEQGITVMEDVRDLRNDLVSDEKSLREVDLKFRRRGMDNDTKYRVDLDEEYQLTDADIRAMEKMVDLGEYFKPHTPEQILRLINGEKIESVMKSDEETTNTTTDEDIEIR